MTGGRVRRVKDYIGNETFMLTYGDGVSNVNISELAKFHQSHGKMVTMSAYNAGQRFGVLDIDRHGQIREFREKTQGDGSLINIGYMVCQPEFIGYIDGDSTVLEKGPLETVAKMDQLMAYRHNGFWQCMDTVREKEQLENHGIESCVYYGYFPGLRSVMMDNHFIGAIREIVCNIRGVQEIICEVLFDDMLLIASTDNKFVKSVVAVQFHDMPKNGHPTQLYHWLRLKLALLADSCAITARKNNNFHFLSSPLFSIQCTFQSLILLQGYMQIIQAS